MKKIFNLFSSLGMFFESFFTQRSGIVWEFVDDINDSYGTFKNITTGKVSTLSKDGFKFRKERLYEFDPKNFLIGFGYLGTQQTYRQTWKAVAHP
jgi:hypothetical protein